MRSFEFNVAQCGDSLMMLRSLPAGCTPLVFFDPQRRGILSKLKFGNESGRQKGRAMLPAMTDEYIDACCREWPRLSMPSGFVNKGYTKVSPTTNPIVSAGKTPEPC
jgi:hypothetical protein